MDKHYQIFDLNWEILEAFGFDRNKDQKIYSVDIKIRPNTLPIMVIKRGVDLKIKTHRFKIRKFDETV